MSEPWPGGIADIEILANGTYQPREDGKEAIVIAVDQDVSDIVAWLPDNPAQWWLCRGNGVILNPLAIQRAGICDEPLHLFSSPMAWLEGHGQGACILDWNIDAPFWLGGLSRLIIDDQGIAQRIHAAYRRPTLPEIRIMGGTERAAA